MNYIEKKARKLAEFRLHPNRIGDAKKLIQIVKDDLYEIVSKRDKLVYLTILLDANDHAYTEHLKICDNLKSCGTNDDHEMLNYFFQQELNGIGFQMNDDIFTRDEKETLTDYFDKFAADLKDLKDGQQVIYDDLYAEIQELKKWFILGKKNWKQFAAGKMGEMVVGGFISEATARPLMEMIKMEMPKILG